MSLNPFTEIAKVVGNVVGEFITDKDKRNELSAQLTGKLMDTWTTELEAQRDVIVAEAQGHSWMQRNWRPVLMFLIMFLLAFNGIAVPLIETIWSVKLPILEAYSAIPSQMWALLQIGLGGYIVGRSGEKMVSEWGRKRKRD